MGDGIPTTREGTVDSYQVLRYLCFERLLCFGINMPFLAFPNEMVSCLGGVGSLNVAGCHSVWNNIIRPNASFITLVNYGTNVSPY